MSARAIGLEMLIRPCAGVGPHPRRRSRYLDPARRCLPLPDRRWRRTPRARPPRPLGVDDLGRGSLPSISGMRPSMKPWLSLAASYSAFSDRSPCARASAIEVITEGPVNGLEAVQFGLELLRPTFGDGNGGHRSWFAKNEKPDSCPATGVAGRPVKSNQGMPDQPAENGQQACLWIVLPCHREVKVCSSMCWPDIAACTVWSKTPSCFQAETACAAGNSSGSARPPSSGRATAA